MALSADVQYQTQGPTRMVAAKSNVQDVYYQGALVNFDANGYIVVAADTAGHVFAGVVKQQVTVGSAETKDIEIEQGIIRVAHSGAAQTDVGAFVYATADDTLADSATNVGPAGKVVDWEAGYLWIDTQWRADS